MGDEDERDRFVTRKMFEQWGLEQLEKPDVFDVEFDLKRPIPLEHGVCIGFEKTGRQIAPKEADCYYWRRELHGQAYFCLLSEDGNYLIPDRRFKINDKRREEALRRFFIGFV
jgi:hypothetical protein